MKKGFYRLCLIFLTCFFVGSCDQQGKDNSELAEIKEQIKELKNEIVLLRQAVTEIHRRIVSPTVAAAPTAPKVFESVEFDDDPQLGDAQASVGIVEFSDYQCPFCRRYHEQVFTKIKSNYIDKGKLKYVFRDFPLDFHAEAKTAAIAANCAGLKGKYWEFSEKLFTNQARIGKDLYKESFEQLGIKPSEFEPCLKDVKQAKEVELDVVHAQLLGVTGTPTFFIGTIKDGKLVDAKLISGAQPYEEFAKYIDALLPN